MKFLGIRNEVYYNQVRLPITKKFSLFCFSSKFHQYPLYLIQFLQVNPYQCADMQFFRFVIIYVYTPFKIGPNGKTRMDKESNLMVCTSITSTLHQSQKNDLFPSILLFLTTRWRWTWSKMHQIKNPTAISYQKLFETVNFTFQQKNICQ